MKDAADQFYRETTNENKEFIKSKIWIFNNFFIHNAFRSTVMNWTQHFINEGLYLKLRVQSL